MTMANDRLVGRDAPVQTAQDWLAARTGSTTTPGSVAPALFVSGEAGVGKSSLIQAVCGTAATMRSAAALPWPRAPYGVLVQALPRLAGVAPSMPAPAATAMPLQVAPVMAQPVALPVEKVREAVLEAGTPAVLVLEDLHWADAATLELLPALVEAVAADPVAIIAGYRNDELSRDHPIRYLRAQLRRRSRLLEIRLEPLDADSLPELLALLLGGRPSPMLVDAVAERTDGVPFFVEELLAGMSTAGRLKRDGDAFCLVDMNDEPPLTESVRDAVLLRVAGMPAVSRDALDVAAVLGMEFDVGMVAELAGHGWPDDLDHCGLLQPVAADRRRFRHALAQEALYSEVPWSRRHALHLAAADRFADTDAAPWLPAGHLLAAREFRRARPTLLAAAAEYLRVYACRDAARMLATALETWPPGDDDAARLDVVARLAHCAELSGDHAAAVTGLRELADQQGACPDVPPCERADTHRRLAVQYELLGQWPPALSARESAARYYGEAALPEEAACERLAIAAHLRSAAGFTAALEVLDDAEASARKAGSPELLSRIGGLRGNLLVRTGHSQEGMALVRSALDLALSHGLEAATAETYQRLADALEHTGDYRAAGRAYDTAYEFCQVHDLGSVGRLCQACATVAMFHSGRWDTALKVCTGVLSDSDSGVQSRAVAHGVRGLVEGMRGHPAVARAALLESRALALRIELVPMELLATWGLALLDSANERTAQALDSYRHIVTRCLHTQERHFSVPILQFAAVCFATAGTAADLGRATEVLADAVNATGQPEARAALTHVLAETALAAGEPVRALEHFSRALGLLAPLDLPVVVTLLRHRAGAAAAAADRAGTAPALDPVDLLRLAYRTAHRLRAGPMAGSIAADLRRLGHEPSGARSAAGSLSPREAQVLRLVAEGLTNKEVGARLFLSVRTVEMHVRNAVAKLGCRTRAEAVGRLAELTLDRS